MSPRFLRTTALGVAVVLLAACAGQRVQTLAPDAASLARQAEREQDLAAHDSWTLQGRLGVSDARDSGSGALDWSQDGHGFRFAVHASITGKTWILSGDASHAVLEGLREQPVRGDDAAELLQRELGWRVPIAELTYWARGLRAPGEARIQFRADGLPGEIDQSGWTVQYLDYDTSRTPALPSKVFATKGDTRVRLAIRAWALR